MEVIGLDIGTAHARAAVVRHRAAALVPGDGGTNALAAAVSLDGNQVHVGARALDRVATHPDATVRSIKNTLERARLVLAGKAITPERLLSALVRELRDRAAKHFGRTPAAAVVAHAGWLRAEERRTLVAAVKRMGLEVVGTLTDATATALTILGNKTEQRRVVVVDVGAGGCSASVLSVMPAGVRLEYCRGEAGVGGESIDAALAQLACRQLEEQLGQLPTDGTLLALLRQSCERAKRDLSYTREAVVAVPWPAGKAGRGAPPEVRFDRAMLHRALARLLAQLEVCCAEVLARARLGPGQADQLYLNGGMTRLGVVRQRVEEFVGLEASSGLHPDGAIAMGAALHAAALTSHEGVLVDEPGDPVPRSKRSTPAAAKGRAARSSPGVTAAAAE
ncbi:MAG: Hsp70 family protein, partial [Deltaproteobacteria bacterium]|nr:Hsp70 family protein [Deltaproteobacteria bacterium]MBW2535643.1 Hsp70 family protein [Deltaproteobacteria bacterium]